MPSLVKTKTELNDMSRSLRSAALAHVSPCDRRYGLDVCDAVDRVIAALNKPAFDPKKRCFHAEIDNDDLFVSGYALPRNHWLRDELIAIGISLCAPKTRLH